MEENMSSTQEKPRDRVMALPEKLRKELLYLAHLDPERQKSTLLHNVAVSGEKIQQLIDSAKPEGAIEELKKTDDVFSAMHQGTPGAGWVHYGEFGEYIDDRIAQLEQSEESK